MTEINALANRTVVAIHPQATVQEVSNLMALRKVGVVVVMEDGRLLGVISERDVVTRVLAEGRDPSKTPVADVMTLGVETVGQWITPEETVQLAHEGRFKQIPMVDSTGQVLGMLAIRDLLAYCADDLDAKNAELTACISADGLGG